MQTSLTLLLITCLSSSRWSQRRERWTRPEHWRRPPWWLPSLRQPCSCVTCRPSTPSLPRRTPLSFSHCRWRWCTGSWNTKEGLTICRSQVHAHAPTYLGHVCLVSAVLRWRLGSCACGSWCTELCLKKKKKKKHVMTNTSCFKLPCHRIWTHLRD